MKIHLIHPLPRDPSTDARQITGLEPWDVMALAPSFPKLTVPQSAIESAEVLREHGPARLVSDQRALWHRFYLETKPPLPTTEEIDVTEAVRMALKAMTKPLEDKDHEELQGAMDRAAHALVARSGDVGLFATRGAIRVTALPDWVKAAVIVNTKDKNWDVVQVGHCAILNLALWSSAAVPGPWFGHRYRIRRKELPTIRELHFAVNGLHHAVCPNIPVRM